MIKVELMQRSGLSYHLSQRYSARTQVTEESLQEILAEVVPGVENTGEAIAKPTIVIRNSVIFMVILLCYYCL